MAVFKLRRPKSQWSAPDLPSFYPDYYFKIRDSSGKQLLRSTSTGDKALALKLESAAKAKVRADGWQALMDALEPVKQRRTVATLGDIADAYLDEAVRLVKDAKQARNNVASLFRVVAAGIGEGFFTVAGRGMRGVKPGTRVVNGAKVRGLAASVLTAQLVRDYFRNRQGGEELDLNTRAAGNRSINSTLNHARQLFTGRALSYKLGELQLPDLSGFLKEPALRAEESEAQPLTGEEWRRMVEAEAALDDRELALVNRILRSTGMRSAEVANLHRGWLLQEDGGWWVEIRDRKELDWSQKGVKNRKVPLSGELAGVLVAREGYLIAPGRSKTWREDLVNRDHNVFLKEIIGGLGERTQGNHRLRDTVCSALWSLYGPATAQEAAGHVDPKTTSKHYAKRMATVPAAMAAEMAIWAPGNVIPLMLRAAG